MGFLASINNENVFPVITLSDSTTNCSTEIYSFGALLNKFVVRSNNADLNIVVGFTSPQDAIENITKEFRSAFLSPFTCRMNKGKFSFDDTAYQVDKFFIEPHAIHGLVYDGVFAIKATEQTETFASVTLTYTYNKEDMGYPFSYTITHVWKLEANNKLAVTSIVQHQNSAPIPYAQGWHPYFSLDTDLDDCMLQFSTDNHVEFDDTLIPTGAIIPDERFKDGVLMKDIFLDNCFHLVDERQHSCVLKNDAIALTISPDASYPYLQIYTPPHRKSIAIENLSGAPDCFNNGLGLLLIQPDQPTIFSTTYAVTVLN